MSKTKSAASDKFKAAVRHCVRVRDQRDAALKAAAAALALLEEMVESGGVAQEEIDTFEMEYERKVDQLVKIDNSMSLACNKTVIEVYKFARPHAKNAEEMVRARVDAVRDRSLKHH